jgi:hypothetical protein
MLKYNAISFKKEFPKTILGNSIINMQPKNSHLIWDSAMTFDMFVNKLNITHRSAYESTLVSMVPFWYINFLLEKYPNQVIDMGCGSNTFKKYIPFVHGIDPVDYHADEIDFFDAQFSRGHTEAYESVMSINALHFISLSDYGLRLREFANIIKPGGRGFVTFNVERMKEHTSDSEFTSLFSSATPDNKQLSNYILSETKSNLQNILVYDNFLNECKDEHLNGNIRIVFDK